MVRRAIESTPSELRRIAADLIRISNDLEEKSLVGSSIEADDGERSTSDLFFVRQKSLLEAVHVLYRERRRRKNFIPSDLFGEPAWDILLDLFASRLEGRRISVTSACIGADVPLTTALRWLKQLEETGFVDRKVSDEDQRVTWVQLSDFGLQSMEAYFRTRPISSDQRDREVSEPFILTKGSG